MQKFKLDYFQILKNIFIFSLVKYTKKEIELRQLNEK